MSLSRLLRSVNGQARPAAVAVAAAEEVEAAVAAAVAAVGAAMVPAAAVGVELDRRRLQSRSGPGRLQGTAMNAWVSALDCGVPEIPTAGRQDI